MKNVTGQVGLTRCKPASRGSPGLWLIGSGKVRRISKYVGLDRGRRGRFQIFAGRVRSGRVVSGQVGSCRIVSGRVGSGRVGSGRVGSGRVGSGRVGSGRVGSGRVGSGRVDPAVRLSSSHTSSTSPKPLFGHVSYQSSTSYFAWSML